MKDGRTYLTDSVPFSCCDPRVRRPCVHHNMLNSFKHTKYDSSNVTVYEVGCRPAMSRHYAETVTGFLKLLVACLVVQLSLTVTFRYLQTSTGAAIEEEDMDMETRGYLWTVAKKRPAQKAPAPTAKGGKGLATGGKTSPGKGGKSPQAKTAGRPNGKREAAKSEKGKNRNNAGPNNNNFRLQDNYNNMTVDRDGEVLSGSDSFGARIIRKTPVTTRMQSTASVLTSGRTSTTHVGESRQTSGTRLTSASRHSEVSQLTNETRSASRQQSHSSVATAKQSASTSDIRRSASAGSGSYASSIRQPAPNMSRNNNVDAVTDSSSTSTAVARQHPLHCDSHCAADLKEDVHTPLQQRQQQEPVIDADAERSSPPAAQNNIQPLERKEVSRPRTPMPIPDVNRPPVHASTRLPRSVPLADFLTSSSRWPRGQTGSSNNSSGNRQSSVARDTGCNHVAMQPPLAAVHKPVVAQSTAVAKTPRNYHDRVGVPTPRQPSTAPPPPLPPRNASTTADSPYVMMYPLRPPRDNPILATRPRTK